MPKVFHFSELLEITFVPMPSKLGAFIAQYEELLMSTLILLIILLSTLGIYDAPILLLIVVGFLAYIFFLGAASRFTPRLPSVSENSYHLARAIIGTIVVVIVLRMLPDARDPLWLLFIFPIWRLLEKNFQKTWALVLVILLAIGAIYYQLSIKLFNKFVFSSSILGETGLRVVWLGVIMAILYSYSEFIHRTKVAEATYLDLNLNIGKQLYQVQTLEDWCFKVLCQAIKVVGGTYATFQVCNRLSGELRLTTVVMYKDGEFINLELSKIPLAESILFSDKESTGITGAVIRQGKAIGLLNVKDDPRYVKIFEDTYTEIAVPIYDLIHDWAGGVINVEYTITESPRSDQELENLKVTLNEMAQLFAAQFSYVTLSDFQDKIREAGLLISFLDDEESVAITTLDALFKQFNCPIAIWLTDENQESRLILKNGRLLPNNYANAGTSVSTYTMFAEIRDPNMPPVQTELNSSYPHWNVIKSMEPRPISVVNIPLRGSQEIIGVIQLFVLRKSKFLKSELEILQDLGHHAGIQIESIRRGHIEREAGDKLAGEMLLAAHELGNSIESIKPLVYSLLNENVKLESRSVGELEMLRSEIDYLEEIKDLVDYQFVTIWSEVLPQKYMGHYQILTIVERAIAPLIDRQNLQREDIVIGPLRSGSEVAYCNRVAVVVAIRNLVKNSIQAGQNRDKIEVSSSISPNGKNVLIDVQNRGRVMTEDEQRRVFEFRFSTTPGGRGIGLASSRLLLRRSRGDLELQHSSKLSGTKFRVVLRRYEDV